MTDFLCAVSTNWAGVLWICRLNQSFTFVTRFLSTFSTNWFGILWIGRLNESLALMTWFLRSFFPTDSLTILISCPLTNCIIFFYWRLKSFDSILQRLFKLWLSWVTQITDILITIDCNNTLSQICFIWNSKSLIIGLQLLVLQGKNLYGNKETLPCSPNQDQTNNFLSMFFWKEQHSHSRCCQSQTCYCPVRASCLWKSSLTVSFSFIDQIKSILILIFLRDSMDHLLLLFSCQFIFSDIGHVYRRIRSNLVRRNWFRHEKTTC